VNNSDPFGLSPDTLDAVDVDHYSSEITARGFRTVCLDRSVAAKVQGLFSLAIADNLPVYLNNAYRGGVQVGTGGRPAAGSRSLHRAGLAFDINSSVMTADQLSSFTTLARAQGFVPVAGDPGHYQVSSRPSDFDAAVTEADRSYAAGDCADQQEAATRR
jgi:hypothetical protein